jgi:peptide/nickel transport system substrate-binding protein
MAQQEIARRTLIRAAGAMGAASLLGPAAFAAAPQRGGSIAVATIGEPPTLDPMESTADVTGMISQHMFETLYTWGEGWKITPLLAAALPQISADNKSYTIKLRDGVKFHDGSTMSSADVLASLKRWTGFAQRGRQTAAKIDSITAPDASTIVIALKEPYAPLLPFLALETSAAIIMPASQQAVPAKSLIGTGPYRFRDHVPDQYVRVEHFDQYSARDDAPSMFGGRRAAYVDGISFQPVPNATTRVDGALAGQYNYGDSLPAEEISHLKGKPNVDPVVLNPFGWPFMFLNLKQGSLTNVAVRQALLASLNFHDMLEAAFGTPDFFTADGAWYPQGYALHSDAGADIYKQCGDTDRAQKMLSASGYKGAPVRFIVSMQYDFHYKMAMVASEYMRQAGFTVDLQVLDWATLLQRRTNPAVWDIYFTHGPILPEPTLFSFMDNAAPGWWSTPARDKAVTAFNAEPDPVKRAPLWGDVQKLIYEEVPVIRVGNFNALAVRSHTLQGLTPAVWPFFWNSYLEKA